MSANLPYNDDSFRLNADFSQQVVIRPQDYHWVPAPAEGVNRMMLDRITMEHGHSTTLVEFAPNAEFPHHIHYLGEEILVLEGIFADQYGEYPTGSYLRNPPGSSHVASVGPTGAKIFVKLHQMDVEDTSHTNINTTKTPWHQGMVPGLQVMPLHQFRTEQVALVKWAPSTQFTPHQHWGGEEIFVIEGTFYDEYGTYPKGSWLRSPHLSRHTPFTKSDGALIYVKIGHLADKIS